MMGIYNPYLTDRNRTEVQAIVDDHEMKLRWIAWAEVYGNHFADKRIASRYNKPLNTVKAASLMWRASKPAP